MTKGAPSDLNEDQSTEFDRLARRYSWDIPLPEARAWPDRLFRRVMDMGLLPDTLAMERVFGHERLIVALTTAPIGALRPKSWRWWHLRLGLALPGEASPAPPRRRIA